jgi:voltage-gated potassium channel Kch
MTPHPLRDLAHAYMALLRAIGAAFRSQRVIILLLVTTFVASSGAVAMMLLEGWSFIDALYFAIVSMATVGYGDLSPETTAGKLFTMGFLVIGIGIFVLTVGAIAEAILSAMPRGKKDEE